MSVCLSVCLFVCPWTTFVRNPPKIYGTTFLDQFYARFTNMKSNRASNQRVACCVRFYADPKFDSHIFSERDTE